MQWDVFFAETDLQLLHLSSPLEALIQHDYLYCHDWRSVYLCVQQQAVIRNENASVVMVLQTMVMVISACDEVVMESLLDPSLEYQTVVFSVVMVLQTMVMVISACDEVGTYESLELFWTLYHHFAFPLACSWFSFWICSIERNYLMRTQRN